MSDINSNLPVQDNADGADGTAAPSIAQQVGGIDGSGNLQAIKVDTSGRVLVNLNDSSGTGLTSTLISGKQSLDVNICTATLAVTQSGTWNINNISGTISLPTGASTAANQVTANASLSSIDAGIPASLGQTIMSASMPVVIASDQSTINVNAIPSDGTKSTYSAAASGIILPALATDIFIIRGSATKTIRITRVEFTGTTTTGSGTSISLQLVKRSTANTGGTTVSDTAIPHDSNNAAASATVVHYTANPSSLGTSVGIVRAVRFTFVTSGLAQSPEVWDFGTRPSQALVLRGTSEFLAINIGSVTITGGIVSINIEWTEE